MSGGCFGLVVLSLSFILEESMVMNFKAALYSCGGAVLLVLFYYVSVWFHVVSL